MTTQAPTTKALLDDVLATMSKSGGGDPAAQAALAAQAQAAANARTVKAKHPPPTAATAQPTNANAVTGLVFPQRTVIRPNGEVYHTRKMGPHDDIAVLQMVQSENLSMLLYGLPGCGKTALFEAAFTVNGQAEFEFVPGDGDTTVADFVGGYVPLPGGGYAWVDGPLPRAMERGVALLVDEVALINPKVMAVVYSTMDGRGILRVTENPAREDVVAKKGFVVIGACNPNAPGARMSEALISRFQLHAEVGVDFNLMRRMGVPAKLITCVQNMKTKVDKGGGLSWFPAIREMLNFIKMEQMFGLEVALNNIVAQAPESARPTVAGILQSGYANVISNPVKTLEIK